MSEQRQLQMPLPDAAIGLSKSGQVEALAEGALILRGCASAVAPQLLQSLESVFLAAPWRHMETPGGYRMSVAMTNCGQLGWVSDRSGYRYQRLDPLSGLPWPAMPELVRTLARGAAAAADYTDFEPDACLVNRYDPGARLSLHQDRNERYLGAPVVSISLGLAATFLFGGTQRRQRPRRTVLESGDVVVWGGPARLAYHGVAVLGEGIHPLTGRCRINLTVRQAG